MQLSQKLCKAILTQLRLRLQQLVPQQQEEAAPSQGEVAP